MGKGCKTLKVGDTVVYSKWGIGVTDLAMQGDEYAVIREMDIIGTFPSSGARACAARRLPTVFSQLRPVPPPVPRSIAHPGPAPNPRSPGATAADVAKLTPLFDRVLVRVAEAADTSKGGVLLPGT